MRLSDFLLFFFLAYGPANASHSESQNGMVFKVTCDQQTQTNCNNKTLETIAAEVKKKNVTDVHIDLELPWLELNASVSFSNLNSLSIRGACGTQLTKFICTSGSNASAGIAISDISGTLVLSNLNLSFCGRKFRLHRDHDKMYSSALTITRCRNVELKEVVIVKSEGIGLMILDHRGGQFKVDCSSRHVAFSENKVQQDFSESAYFGGGGVYLSLKHYPYSPPSPMTFRFQGCKFIDNVAHTKEYKYSYNDILGRLQNGYGHGGGAYVYISSGLSNISVSFAYCNFTNNHAFIGGGLSVTIRGKSDSITRNVTVSVVHSQFKMNGCYNSNATYYTGFGGGANWAFSATMTRSGLNNSHYYLRNVTFIENCAQVGGGVYYYSYCGRSEGINTNSMIFYNSTFAQNKAHLGSAFAMTPNTFHKLTGGYKVMPTFNNCQFYRNNVSVKFSQLTSRTPQRIGGIGTIYSSLYNIHFEGFNIFHHNKGSAIYAVNGIVNFTNTNVSFVNNSGLNGGAVGLIGSSTMFMGPNTYEFINNSALYRGGAIYVLLVDAIDFISSRSCFIQYVTTDDLNTLNKERRANITFIGSKAKSITTGHTIYATSLHPCQVIKNGSKYFFLNVSEIFTTQSILFDNDQQQIATDGNDIRSTKQLPLLIIPGERYCHGVSVADDLGYPTEASFRVAISKDNDSYELNSTSLFVRDKIQLIGEPGKSAILYLETLSPRQNYVKLRVKLLECPPGFKLNNKYFCVCNAGDYVGIVECDLNNFHGHLLSGFWAGRIDTHNGLELVTSRCPFCDYSASISNDTDIILPQKYSELNRTLCGQTRNGVLCGRCEQNYTVHFHSPGFLCKPAEPVECKLGWFFYILSELVPVTVVFITVLVLNISFTSGAVNGFILFGQLLDSFYIDANGIITFPESAVKEWIQGYRVIYGFINFNFFNYESLSFCLWKKASALDMLAMKYVTILYTLLLIVAVILFMNKCGGRCCGKCCRITTIKTSVVHGITTFLVMCYAKCVTVSLDLLIPVWLAGNGLKLPARVWLNGDLLYLSNGHLPYALPAMVCLVTIGLVPLGLLLTYPLASKMMSFLSCDDLKIVNAISKNLSINNLKPLLDSIQGCFKDNFRFFAGLYFLYRWIIPFVHIVSDGFDYYYTILGGVLLFILTLHTICQPYNKRTHNIIDTLLFADLVLINFLSFFNYYGSQTQWHVQQRVTISFAIIQLILIYLPIAVTCIHLLILSLKVFCWYVHRNMTAKFTPEWPNTFRKLKELIGIKESNVEEEHSLERIVDDDLEYTHTYEYFNCEYSMHQTLF